MPSFLTHYQSIKSRKERGDLLNKLSLELGVSYITVSQKITKLKNGNNLSFTKLEKERISDILHQPVEELFPEPALLKN